MEQGLCQFIADVCKDPSQIVTGLKVRELVALQEHVLVCDTCSDLIDQAIASKNADPKPDTEWDRTKYN